MILVRLTASDLRILEKATSGDDALGVVSLLKVRVEEAKVLREFGKTAKVKEEGYSWKDAINDMLPILGQELRFPPHPDRVWYIKLQRTITSHGINKEYVEELARYAKEKMKAPFSFDFLISQHQRVLGGAFDNQSARRNPNTFSTPRQATAFIEDKLC